jgi:hypothetical protein
LYVPPKPVSPLYLLDNSGPLTRNAYECLVDALGSVNPVNGFLVPQWGGLFIYNDPATGSTNLVVDTLKPVFEVFLSQLRDLLGIKPVWPDNDISRQILHVRLTRPRPHHLL